MNHERLISKIEMGTKLMTVINQARVNRIGKAARDRDKNLLGLLLDDHKHHWHPQHLHRAARLR